MSGFFKRESLSDSLPLVCREEREAKRRRGLACRTELVCDLCDPQHFRMQCAAETSNHLRVGEPTATRRVALRSRIPTGFRPRAQGCEARATLGHRPRNIPNRNAVEAHPFPPAPDLSHDAVGVDSISELAPKVRVARQPWAGGPNPFGIVRSAGLRPVVFGRRFALSAQPRFLSLSSSKKEERAGERRCSVSPLSGSLPARSSQGERGKTPQAFCVPNTTGHRPALRPALRLRAGLG